VPTRVYLLRHAESADPTVFHGAESDVGLSERGVRQAEAIAGVLAALRPAMVVSSGMRRARETAYPILRACGQGKLGIEPALHERKVGALSGQPVDGEVWPETLGHWLAGRTNWAPPGAESYDDIRARVVPAWERVTAELDGSTFVLVAHGVVCKVLLLEVVPGLSLADWPRLGRIANVAVHELHRAGPPGSAWELCRFNDLPEAVRGI
jgi:broad specificity phosphatase PhoE